MFLKAKKPLSPRRKAFQYVGAAFLGLHFGGSAMVGVINDRTAEQAERLGLSEATLRNATKAKFTIHYLEDKAAYVVPTMQILYEASNKVANENRYNLTQGARYAFLGVAFKNPVHGYRGPLDRMTFHLASKISSCTIVIPSDRLDMETLQQILTGLDPQKIRHFPGTLKEYKALMLLHEIYHCDQNPHDDGEIRERLADIDSMSFYLTQGGNLEIVRSLTYGRSLNALMALIGETPESSEQLYIMGPALEHRFFGGPFLSPEDVAKGHKEAVQILFNMAGPKKRLDLYNPEILYHTVCMALEKADPAMSSRARIILSQNKAAYEFFIRPNTPVPAAKPAFS